MRIRNLSIIVNLSAMFFICQMALAQELSSRTSDANELTKIHSDYGEIRRQVDILYPADDAAKTAVLRTSVNRMLDQRVPITELLSSMPQTIVGDAYDSDVRFSGKLLSMTLNVQIWKGKNTMSGEFPGVVALKNGDRLTCTGTVIGEDAILTARHCVCKDTVTRFYAEHEQGEIIRTVPKADCQSGTSEIDLAIIFVKPLVSLPAARFASSRLMDAGRVTVVGFGRTHQPLSDPEGIQRKAEVVVVSSRCGGSVALSGHAYRDSDYYGCIYDYEFVAKGAGDDDRPADTCKGDSGGPAFAFDRGRSYLTGVTSRPAKASDIVPSHIVRPQGRCGDGGIYVRMDETRLAWVKEQVGPIAAE